MFNTFTRRSAFGFGAGVALLRPAFAQQERFPDRPIRLIVPWPPGGSTDGQMRSMAEIAARHLGQPIVIENRPGVSGTLGALVLKDAKPDGYTLAQMPISVFRLPQMTDRPNFDPLNDFLCPTRHRLHLRRRLARRPTLAHLAGLRRPRQGESGAGHLRHARRGQQPAHHDGADRRAARHPMDARPLPGRRRKSTGDVVRHHRRDRRLDRLGAAGRGRAAALARDLGGRARQALSGRADAPRSWDRHRLASPSASPAPRAWTPAR